MSQEAPGVADERLEKRPVSGGRPSVWTLDEQSVRRVAYHAGGAVRVRGRRRRRGARRASCVDRRGRSDERLDDPGDADAYHRAGRRSCRTRARWRPGDLGACVDQDDGVRRHFRFVFDEELQSRIEVVRGRFFYDDRLGQRLRKRLRKMERRWRQLERREKCFRRWRLELVVYRCSGVWRRRCGAQTRTVCHVER